MFLSLENEHSQMDALRRQMLRTKERDSRQPEQPARGSRYWTTVEVPGDMFFMVECAVAVNVEGTRYEVQRNIATDFWVARDLYAKTACEWVRLYAYIREPSIFDRGHTFQTVVEVSQVGTTDRLLFRFESGLMMHVADGRVSHEAPMDVVRKVFPIS